MKILEAFQSYGNENIIALGGSYNTYVGYSYAAKAFVSGWGDIELELINLDMVRRFGYEFRRNHSTGTLRNYLACLRSVLQEARKRGESVLDYTLITLPKLEKRIPDYLEPADIDELIRAASRRVRGYPELNRVRNALIIKMLFVTGLRVGELCRLDIHDIKDREFVVVGKSKEPRLCFITKEVEEEIKYYLKLRHDRSPALFVSNQTGGKRISPKTVQSVFRRVSKAAGLEGAHPHTMRHSFCTYLITSGVSVADAATIMGHQSWNTTKIYTHIKNERLKSTYDAVCS